MAGALPRLGWRIGGAQATLRAASRLRYLQYDTIGGRQASQARMEVGVDSHLFVVHLWTRCQKLFIPLSAMYVGLRRSAPYVSMGQRRPVAMR